MFIFCLFSEFSQCPQKAKQPVAKEKRNKEHQSFSACRIIIPTGLLQFVFRSGPTAYPSCHCCCRDVSGASTRNSVRLCTGRHVIILGRLHHHLLVWSALVAWQCAYAVDCGWGYFQRELVCIGIISYECTINYVTAGCTFKICAAILLDWL